MTFFLFSLLKYKRLTNFEKTATWWLQNGRKKQTLFSATINGVFFFFSRLIDSIVCGSNPCIISTTKTAISHKLEPRERRLLKDTTRSVTGLTGLYHIICYLLEKLKRVFANINWIPKLIVQFCYLRLYLGFKAVSVPLLLGMARMDLDWNLRKSWANLFKF